MRPGRHWLNGAALPLATLLTACGGGGGVVSTPIPPPETPVPAPTPTPTPPTPTPTPTPTPVPTSPSGAPYDTAEYRATVGAVSLNALAAYNRGATGLGIGVGIIDTGIDLASEEFGGRISGASASVAGNASIDDEGGHGTAVAFTVAGRRNGAGTQGVAYDSTLVVLRADRPGSCATEVTDDKDTGCRFGTDAIARGVDAARLAGTRVINISLGGDSMGAQLTTAIGRAAAAGIVVVIAAGNDGTADPSGFSAVANNDAVARNQVIIAGSVGTGDAISTFSDRAGSSAAHFLSAVGERVRAPDENNVPFLWSGTSFSAPQITGAVALLAQAFPNLSGAQIVDLLYATARDAGDPGVDAVYGRGIVDLARAFQPVGATAMAGSAVPVSIAGSNGATSAPMGDARQSGLGAVILDGYGRAFGIDLAQTLARGAAPRVFGGALQSNVRAMTLNRGGTAVSVTLVPVRGGVDMRTTRLGITDARAARAIAGSVVQRLGARLSFGIGVAQGTTALTAQLDGRRDPAFLVAADRGLGVEVAPLGAVALRHRFGRLGVTAAASSSDLYVGRETAWIGARPWTRHRVDQATVTLDREAGPLALRLAGSRLAEHDTLLGAQFGSALGSPRATSWFAEGNARFSAGDGWTVGGSWRQGWTTARLRSEFRAGGAVRTSAWSADIGKDGLFGPDSIGLRIAQPLRVSAGGVDLRLPTLYDYATLSVATWTTQRLNLAPDGRELDLEVRYARRLGPGDLSTNLFWRRDPGNVAALPDDRGVALRYAMGF